MDNQLLHIKKKAITDWNFAWESFTQSNTYYNLLSNLQARGMHEELIKALAISVFNYGYNSKQNGKFHSLSGL